MARDKERTQKAFQITMDKQVHDLLKRRARVLNMNIGGLIQNMFASLERRLEVHKARGGVSTNTINDELDARLINVLLKRDAGLLSDDEVQCKFDTLIEQYQTTRPTIDFIDVTEDD